MANFAEIGKANHEIHRVYRSLRNTSNTTIVLEAKVEELIS